MLLACRGEFAMQTHQGGGHGHWVRPTVQHNRRNGSKKLEIIVSVCFIQHCYAQIVLELCKDTIIITIIRIE